MIETISTDKLIMERTWILSKKQSVIDTFIIFIKFLLDINQNEFIMNS
jgi:hypothetical protein